MKPPLKTTFFLLFSLFFSNSFSQEDKASILAHFDYVEYYPDSTIQAAYNYTGVYLERFAVEFSTIGKPVAMGIYQKGKRTGKWIYADGSSDYFLEKPDRSSFSYSLTERTNSAGNRTGSIHPGCGTGKYQATKEFYKAYDNLLTPQTTNE
jgi:hypothetical protein